MFCSCAFLVPEFHFPSDSQMRYLTFVLVLSRRRVVLLRVFLSLSSWKNTFFWAKQEKEDKNNDAGANYCLKSMRKSTGPWIRNPGRWCPFRQQFLPEIHEKVICGDLKALFSVDSMSIFLAPSTYYRTSKWVSWLDISLTLSGLPPAPLSKHLCVKATDNLNSCYCVISLPTVWWFPDHFRTTSFIFVSSSVSRMTSVISNIICVIAETSLPFRTLCFFFL